MKHLMNSAIMPADGIYRKRRVSKEVFKAAFLCDVRCFVSSIGYPETAKVLERLLCIPVPVSRDETKLIGRCTLYVARVPYRVANPAQKGAPRALTADDLEYSIVEYSPGDVKQCKSL